LSDITDHTIIPATGGGARRNAVNAVVEADEIHIGSSVRPSRWIKERRVAGCVEVAIQIAGGDGSNRLPRFGEVASIDLPASNHLAEKIRLSAGLRLICFSSGHTIFVTLIGF
jgi:hypothetical protein